MEDNEPWIDSDGVYSVIVQRPYLGITIAPSSLTVTEVHSGSLAKALGIRVGDEVVSVAGQLAASRNWANLFAQAKIPFRVEFYREIGVRGEESRSDIRAKVKSPRVVGDNPWEMGFSPLGPEEAKRERNPALLRIEVDKPVSGEGPSALMLAMEQLRSQLKTEKKERERVESLVKAEQSKIEKLQAENEAQLIILQEYKSALEIERAKNVSFKKLIDDPEQLRAQMEALGEQEKTVSTPIPNDSLSRRRDSGLADMPGEPSSPNEFQKMQREEWKKGDFVEIFSQRFGDWITGKIISLTPSQAGNFVDIIYNDGSAVKLAVSIYSPTIQPSNVIPPASSNLVDHSDIQDIVTQIREEGGLDLSKTVDLSSILEFHDTKEKGITLVRGGPRQREVKEHVGLESENDEKENPKEELKIVPREPGFYREVKGRGGVTPSGRFDEAFDVEEWEDNNDQKPNKDQNDQAPDQTPPVKILKNGKKSETPYTPSPAARPLTKLRGDVPASAPPERGFLGVGASPLSDSEVSELRDLLPKLKRIIRSLDLSVGTAEGGELV
ncbi:hypothetical protein AAMO2058_000237100 [Amorphochlora amoebiformis]